MHSTSGSIARSMFNPQFCCNPMHQIIIRPPIPTIHPLRDQAVLIVNASGVIVQAPYLPPTMVIRQGNGKRMPLPIQFEADKLLPLNPRFLGFIDYDGHELIAIISPMSRHDLLQFPGLDAQNRMDLFRGIDAVISCAVTTTCTFSVHITRRAIALSATPPHFVSTLFEHKLAAL